jgi:hypothetical protein
MIGMDPNLVSEDAQLALWITAARLSAHSAASGAVRRLHARRVA